MKTLLNIAATTQPAGELLARRVFTHTPMWRPCLNIAAPGRDYQEGVILQ